MHGLEPIPLDAYMQPQHGYIHPKVTSDEKSNRQKKTQSNTAIKLNREKCEINARKMNYYFKFQICVLCLCVSGYMHWMRCMAKKVYMLASTLNRTSIFAKHAFIFFFSQAESCSTYCLQVFYCIYIVRLRCRYGSPAICIPHISKRTKTTNKTTNEGE